MFSQNHEAITGFGTGTILKKGIFWLYSQTKVTLFKSKESHRSSSET